MRIRKARKILSRYHKLYYRREQIYNAMSTVWHQARFPAGPNKGKRMNCMQLRDQTLNSASTVIHDMSKENAEFRNK